MPVVITQGGTEHLSPHKNGAIWINMAVTQPTRAPQQPPAPAVPIPPASSPSQPCAHQSQVYMEQLTHSERSYLGPILSSTFPPMHNFSNIFLLTLNNLMNTKHIFNMFCHHYLKLHFEKCSQTQNSCIFVNHNKTMFKVSTFFFKYVLLKYI